MSSSSTFIVGIGPSGTSQLTIPLSTPSTASPTLSGSLITLTLTTMSSITLSGTSTSSTSPPAETAPASAASQTPNIGAMVGGSVGGALALLWILGLIYYAHRHSCFRRPGYTRHKEEKSGGFGFGFGKRDSSAAAAPVTEPVAPQPVSGFGARTFGVNARTFDEIRPSVYGGEVSTPGRASYADPPRPAYADPPRTGYAEPPRTTFGQLPPAPTLPTKSNHTPRTSVFGGERPRSSFGERPRSGFGDRPRSGFGDRRSPSRRGFFNSGRDTEWEGAGRRINVEPGAEEEGRGGVFGWFARMKDHAANRRRVQAEYEEDMKRMRGRTAVESDYTRY